jgi:dihydroorotase-like cyclic amidohydrolase
MADDLRTLIAQSGIPPSLCNDVLARAYDLAKETQSLDEALHVSIGETQKAIVDAVLDDDVLWDAFLRGLGRQLRGASRAA